MFLANTSCQQVLTQIIRSEFIIINEYIVFQLTGWMFPISSFHLATLLLFGDKRIAL